MLTESLERTERTMREETKYNLQQLVIDLHYRAGKTGDLELRKLADSLNEIIKKS